MKPIVTLIALIFLVGCDILNPLASNGQRPDFYVDAPDSSLLAQSASAGEQPFVDRKAKLESFAFQTFGYVVPTMTDALAFRQFLDLRVKQNLSRLVLCEGGLQESPQPCASWGPDIQDWVLRIAQTSFPGIADVRNTSDPVGFALHFSIYIPELAAIYGITRRMGLWTQAEVTVWENWARRMEKVVASADFVWDNLPAFGFASCNRFSNHRTQHLRGRGALLASVADLDKLAALKQRYLLLLDKAIVIRRGGVFEAEESCEKRTRPEFSIYDSYRDPNGENNGYGYSVLTTLNLVDFAVIYERALDERIWDLQGPHGETLSEAVRYLAEIDASVVNGVYTIGLHTGRPRVQGPAPLQLFEVALSVLPDPLIRSRFPFRRTNFSLIHLGLAGD